MTRNLPTGRTLSEVVGGKGSIRATVGPLGFTKFVDDATTGHIESVNPGLYDNVYPGYSLWIPPPYAQGPGHGSFPYPQYGGLYLVTGRVSGSELVVTRDPRMDTSEKIAGIALVAVDNEEAAVYQIRTGPSATLDEDPQVCPMIARPAPLAEYYVLQSNYGELLWVEVTP